MLRENSEQYSLHNYSYCLMTNHVRLAGKFPVLYNARCFGLVCVLLQSKTWFERSSMARTLLFRRFDETHFWAALRYVERNPVRAGMVKLAEAYE